MVRFVALALPLVTLELGFGGFLQEALGLGPLGRAGAGGWRLAEWGLEAITLTALFLLVQGRSARWWQDGLLAGAVAWVFRGALPVVTLARLTHLPREPWLQQVGAWLVLYLVAGWLLAALARRLEVAP